MSRLLPSWQDPGRGALPTLLAATSPAAVGGAYFGPDGFGEFRGPPAAAKVSRRGRDLDTATRPWAVSEDRTGVPYPATRVASA